MSAPLVGSDYTYTFYREAAFGTAVTTSGVQFPSEELTIEHNPVTHVLQRATGLRGTIEDDAWQDTVGSTPTASCSFYLSEGMMVLLPAVLQDSTDYAAASSIWTFTTNNYSSLPSFADDEGYFYTLLANSPVATGDDAYITSAIGNSLSLSIAPDANEGCLFASMEFVGKTSTVSATVAPTVSVPSMSSLYKWSDLGAVSFSAFDLLADFISAEWSISNSAKAIPSAPAADFALPRWEVTGSMTLLDDSTTVETMKNMVLSTAPGGAQAFKVFFGTTAEPLTGAGDALINCYVVLNSFSVDNAEESKVTFNFTGHFSADGSTAPFVLKYYES